MVAELILVSCSQAELEGLKDSARQVARSITAGGVNVREQISVCFGKSELQKAIASALGRSSVVLTLGGLDRGAGYLTKLVAAQGMNLPMEANPAAHSSIQLYCRRTGDPFRPEDSELAKAPKGSVVFPNRYGKTPGIAISSARQHLIMLPGGRKEAASLINEAVLAHIGVDSDTVLTRTLRTYGVSEELVRKTLGGLLASSNPAVTVHRDGAEVLVRVSARDTAARQASELCTAALRQIVGLLGDAAYGLDVDSLQAAVTDRLRRRKMGLAVAESGSEGMLARIVGETVGGADVLWYSVSADSDEVKRDRLDVPAKLLKKQGGVSEGAAVHMANAVREKSGADIAVAVTVGDGSGRRNPHGLVYIAVCDDSSVYVKKLVVGSGTPEERDLVLDTALSRALNMVRLFADYLPEGYMAAVPLSDALDGKTVTGRQSYGETAEQIGTPVKESLFRRCFVVRKTDRVGVKVRKVLFILAVLIFLGAGGYVGKYYYDAYMASNLAAKLQNMYEYGDMQDVEITADFPGEYLRRFGALYTLNSDVVGFVSIEGTPLAYPVVQGPDNEYYLRRDYNQKSNDHGIPFMDWRADIRRPSDNMVIYGHNMRDGQLFGELMKYNVYDKSSGGETALEYYREHPVIDFATLLEERQYKIFSVFITNAYENQGEVFQYHNFIDSAGDQDFANYIRQLQLRSIIDTGVDVRPGDKLLTLSTCTYEFKDARFVVVARALRDGESAGVDVSGAQISRQPLMPEIWYRLFGGSPPTVDSASVVTSPTAYPPSSASPASSSMRIISSLPAQSVVLSEPESTPLSQSQSAQEAPPPESSSEPEPEPESSEPEPESSEPESSAGATDESAAAIMQEQVSSTTSEPENADGNSTNDDSSQFQAQADLGDESESQGPESTAFVPYSGTLTVTAGGQRVTGDALDIISRIVQNEIGSGFHTEAMKAQAVAAFSYISFYNQNGTYPSMLLADTVSSKVYGAVSEVIGRTVYYGNQIAFTPFYATSCGTTTSSQAVWGGAYPYLVPVDSSVDRLVAGYMSTKTFTSSQVADLLYSKLGIDAQSWGAPESWLSIQSYTDGGYVGTVNVCGNVSSRLTGTAITGRILRENVFGLRSACFEISYNPSSDSFVFTTYGYGHGVGMSQNGANQYAQQGWSYDQILTHYYPGTTVN